MLTTLEAIPLTEELPAKETAEAKLDPLDPKEKYIADIKKEMEKLRIGKQTQKTEEEITHLMTLRELAQKPNISEKDQELLVELQEKYTQYYKQKKKPFGALNDPIPHEKIDSIVLSPKSEEEFPL